MSSHFGFPKPIRIRITYDRALERITGKREEKIIVNNGIYFIFFLSTIFASYPEIEKRYPPGTLLISLNGKRPSEFDVLHDGDEVDFKVVEIRQFD